MPVKTNAQLAAYFNTGDQPSESNFGDLIDTLQPTPVLISDGTATLTEAANACRINVLPDVASTSNTYDLPTPSAGGIWYRFIYGGAAADDENHIFATATTDETVLFKGGVNHNDTNADNVAVIANGTSHSTLTITDTAFLDLTFIAYSTSVWYVVGTATSSTVPQFGTQ